MNLQNFARDELARAGLFDADSDYDGMLGTSVMELINVFARQGHSGFSAGMVASIFAKLVAYEPLTPLTFDADEWEDRSEMSGAMLWQNNRQSTIFSELPGVSWYNLDEEGQPRHSWDERP